MEAGMLARKTFFGGNDGWGREDWAPGACQRYDLLLFFNMPPAPQHQTRIVATWPRFQKERVLSYCTQYWVL